MIVDEHRLARTTNQSITVWSHNIDKLVVGIDGYPGVGKSTLLADLLKLNLNILGVARDDFVIARTKFKKILDRAEDRTLPFEFDMIDLPRFRKFIEAYRAGVKTYTNIGYNGLTGKIDVKKTYDFSKPILLVEGVFLFHPKLSDDLWDRRIFLKGDQGIISARRVAREKARWGKEYFPEDHPDSYFRLAMLAFDRYVNIYHPEDRADIILDTTQLS